MVEVEGLKYSVGTCLGGGSRGSDVFCGDMTRWWK